MLASFLCDQLQELVAKMIICRFGQLASIALWIHVVPPEGNFVLLVGPLIREFKLRNDDADTMNFKLPGMARGDGFAEGCSSRSSQIKMQFAALHGSVVGK
jgi:hypothetical protein